jgi:hypothetical protein
MSRLRHLHQCAELTNGESMAPSQDVLKALRPRQTTATREYGKNSIVQCSEICGSNPTTEDLHGGNA